MKIGIDIRQKWENCGKDRKKINGKGKKRYKKIN